VRVGELGVDLISLAGHKLYAPKGVGALYVRPGLELAPVLRGAGQEHGVRPGTENVAGIVGLGAACALAGETLDAEEARLRALGAELLERLQRAIPGVLLNGPFAERLPNTVNVSFPGVSGNALLDRCPELAASTGAACHEGGAEEPSGVLAAMGLERSRALGAVRLTLGRGTTAAQVEQAVAALGRAHGELAAAGGGSC
jgi:cysteine desulfurase